MRLARPIFSARLILPVGLLATCLAAETSHPAGALPLLFEPNLGQTNRQARFLVRAAGMTSFLTDGGNVIVLSSGAGQGVVRIELDGAKTPDRFEGVERTASFSNYFIGDDPSKWIT